MIPARQFLLAGVFLAVSVSLLHAQERSPGMWFLRQVFVLADFNGDQQLSRGEASQLTGQLDYYHGDPGFTDSDLNGDQLLSLEELEKTAWKAMVHRLSSDEQELRRLQSEFSYLGEAQVRYLERYPRLARQLLGNVVWTREHPKLVRKLTRNRSWLREQPEAADALQNNLIFWMENPLLAASYYERPPAGNDAALFEAWRRVHRRYLGEEGSPTERFRLEFPYFPLPQNQPEEPQLAAAAPPSSTVNDGSNEEILREAPSIDNDNSQLLDSLRDELESAYLRIGQLEEVINAITEQNEVDANSNENIASLQAELNLLRIELRLARLEEDSLLAANIRQRRDIAELNSRLTADSLQMSRPALEWREEKRLLQQEALQLRTFISNQALRLDSLTMALQRSQQQLAAEEARLEQLTRMQSSQQQELIGAVDSLSRNLSSLRDSVGRFENDASSLTTRNQRQELRIDSLRLELVQSGIRRQRLADSILVLSRMAIRRADSLQFLRQTLIQGGSTDDLADSLFAELELAEAQRFAADQRWRGKMDSMTLLLEEVRQTSGSMAMRADDVNDEDLENAPYAQLRQSLNSLSYDNQKLRQQLEATTRVGREQERILREQLSAVLKNNRRLEYQNRKLRRRLNTRRVPSSTTAVARMDEANFELTEARARIQELESINETLLLQLQASQSYILQKMREEEDINRRLANEMLTSNAARYQADTLSLALANALKNSWPDTVAMLRNEIRDMIREQKELERRAVQARVFYFQQRDSLVEVINDRDLELIRRDRNNSVDEERFARIEARERELEALRLELEARRRLLDQRDQVIQEKIQELDELEQRYLGLEAWERELKRREQLLRIQEEGEE